MAKRIVRGEATRDRSRLIKEALARKPTAGTFYNSPTNGKTRALPLGPNESPHSILITGGIGDFLALDSLMRPEERAAINTICYATRQHAPIRQLIARLPSYDVKNHVVIWDDWSEFFCFLFKSEVMGKLGVIPEVLRIATDYGITRKFPEYTRDARVYSTCSPLMFTIADVGKFALPKSYICVCPYTINDKRLKERDFTDQDWISLLGYMELRNLSGVVLNIGDDPVPEHSRLVNLSNKTTLEESIEVLKGSQGYIGIDSALSVLAAKLFVPPNIVVKSNNKHLMEWQHIYYSPLKEFSFIVPNMDLLNKPRSATLVVRNRYNNRKIRPR